MFSGASETSQNGVLYIVATPIGNRSDITLRALEVLKCVDLIVAEDTRHSRKILEYHSINTKLMAMHEHNEINRSEQIITLLKENKNIALISDAGTPLISDPGYHLVKQAQQNALKVVPIPGANAAICALSAAGLATDRFCFEGFLPSKEQARNQALEILAKEQRTLVFYEAPHRLVKTLKAMLTYFGPERKICLARELTKTFETIHTDELHKVVEWVNADPNQQKGECVLILEGSAPIVEEDKLTLELIPLIDAFLQNSSVKTTTQNIVSLTGLSKNTIYDKVLQRHEQKE